MDLFEGMPQKDKQEELRSARDAKEQMIQDLAVELNSDVEYQAFRELERKEADLKAQIKEDKAEVRELKKAVSEALADVEKLLKVKDVDTCILEYKTILDTLEECDSLAMVFSCLAHNKTLAAQLYNELKEFFPHNAVEYFVS